MSLPTNGGTYVIRVSWKDTPIQTSEFFSSYEGAKAYWHSLDGNERMTNASCEKLIWRIVDMKTGEVSI